MPFVLALHRFALALPGRVHVCGPRQLQKPHAHRNAMVN